MSNQEKILQYKQTQLQALNKAIRLIHSIKPGIIYRFTFGKNKETHLCIATLHSFNRESIRLNILATDKAYPIVRAPWSGTLNQNRGKNPSPDYVQSLGFAYIKNWEELPNQDLALCLGYDIKTQYLERFFK